MQISSSLLAAIRLHMARGETLRTAIRSEWRRAGHGRGERGARVVSLAVPTCAVCKDVGTVELTSACRSQAGAAYEARSLPAAYGRGSRAAGEGVLGDRLAAYGVVSCYSVRVFVYVLMVPFVDVQVRV